MLLLSAAALAAPPTFTAVSEPARLLKEASGTWPRLIAREDGSWFLIMANGGDLYWRTLHADLSVKDESRHNMTNHAGLTDHAIAQCPDGGLIDAASSYGNDWDDTMTVFRWDADFNLINQYTLDEYSTTHSFADAAIICEEDFTAVGGFIHRNKDVPTTPLYRLDPDTAEVIGTSTLLTALTWFGAAWAWDGDNALSLRASTDSSEVFIDRIDPETWEGFEGGNTTTILDPDADTHWFVRTLAWGDYWIVPFIHLSRDYNWQQGSGDIFVAVFDADWSLVSTTRVTDYGGGTAATQPWVTTNGDVIAVSWSNNNSPYGAILTLAEPEPEDTGEDTYTPGDSGEPVVDSGGGEETGLTTAPLTEEEEPEGCGGCSSTGGRSGWLLAGLMVMLPLRRRFRRVS